VPVRVERLAGEFEEAHAAALWCRARLAGGLSAGQIAVLYRARSQATALQEGLALAQVPHRTLGAGGLLERAIVRDALAHLRLAVNPRDRVAFARAAQAPRRGLGPVAIAALAGHAASCDGDLVVACETAQDSAGLRANHVRAAHELAATARSIAARADDVDLTATVIDALGATGLLRAAHAGTGAEGRLAALRELARLARRLHAAEPTATLRDLLAHAALLDDPQPEGGRVTLATVHAAKRLEWRAVRVVGLQDGLFPHARALQEGLLEDERRLAYVALTRAREELVLSWAASRHGATQLPSRFLFECGAVSAQRARAA
jgi:DNA helicase-2/ATP-dependent DNA helicase PcrA